MKRDQLVGRYGIKLASSVLIAICNAIIQFLLPKAISVEEYGFYSYNLNVFTSVVLMANFSASSALVAKYSKKCEDIGYARFYLLFFAMTMFFLSIGLTLLYGFKTIQKSFGGQTLIIVLLGLETSILIKLITDINSLYDAAAISRFPAIMQILQRFFLCLFVICSYLFGHFNLIAFYVGQLLILSCFIVILINVFLKDYRRTYNKPVIRKSTVYFKEFYFFCKPLVIAGLISQGIIIFMNFTLMKYSGVKEQAMFGVALQLNTLVGYLFTPYAELMKREFSIISNDQQVLLYRLYQSVKIIIWLSSYCAVFIAMNADWLLTTIYGDTYSSALSITRMIMFYTIFQAWGQLCGSFMIATESTRGYAVLSILGQIISFTCVFVFQIPNVMFKNGLGSMGIGLSYVCTNYLTTIIMMTYILKKNRIFSIRMHGIYIIAIGICAVFSFLIKQIFRPLFYGETFTLSLLGIITSGVVYTIVLCAFFLMFPRLIGFNRQGINRMLYGIIKKWKRR